MLNKERFIRVISGLCDLYGKTASQFLFDTYYEIFKDHTNEDFEKAIYQCLKNRVYNSIPKPAEILEFLEGTRSDKALTAWLQVLEAVQKGGYYASITFSDPIIAHCVQELGGWQWFCSQNKDELPFLEKRFMNLYRLLLKRGIKTNIRLIGFIEASNTQKGFTKYIPEPIRIGFEGQEIKKLNYEISTK